MTRHYVSNKPFDPYDSDTLTPEQERVYFASQGQLMRWKLKRHKMAVLTVIGMFLSDIALAFLDPRIRLGVKFS